MSTLYTPGSMIFKLREQFLKFLSGLGKPMRQHLLTLAFAILALNGFQSVKASYDRFMSRISARKLKSYYYALSQGDISLDVLMNNLVRTALELTDKEGKQAIIISIDDTLMEDVPGAKYRAGTKAVKTRLFGGRIMYAIVTQTKSEKGYRLFLCSENPEKLCFDLEFLKNEHALAYARHDISLLPLTIYSMRWAIEVSYYEQKQFWALGDYMLRTRNGIERLINLQTLVYAYVKLLPYLSKDFSCLKECSPQQTRFVLGSLVQQQIFLSTLPLPLEDIKNSAALGDFFQAQLLSFISAA